MSIAGKVFRWLMVPATAVAIVVLGGVGGRWLVTVADSRCGAENMIGGACVEAWHTGLIEMVAYVAVAIVALLLSLVPATIAPSLKRTVALLGAALLPVVLGLIYYRFAWPEFLLPLLIAAVAGAAGVVWVSSRSRKIVA